MEGEKYAVSSRRLLSHVPEVRSSRNRLLGPGCGYFVSDPAQTVDRSLSMDHGCFNWKVVPIDEAREIRNTRILGIVLATLSLTIFFAVFFRL